MVVGPLVHDSLVQDETPQPELELTSVQPPAEIKYANTPLRSGCLTRVPATPNKCDLKDD